jgi:glycosidase
MDEYPNFSMVGEEWSLNPLIDAYWQRGKENHDGYKSCLTSIMDFPMQAALVEALKEQDIPYAPKGFTKLYEALANDFVYADPKRILVFGDNHDMDRLFTQLSKDVALTKMALTYILTVRGIPQLFYGTELLTENSDHPNHHGYIRSDFPGGWKDDKANGFTGIGLSAEQLTIQSYLKQLLNWRKKNPVIADGETLHFAPFDGVYVYFRYSNEKTIMVVMNKNEKKVAVDTKRFAEILKSKSNALNIISGEYISIVETFSVPPKTALVLEIQ